MVVCHTISSSGLNTMQQEGEVGLCITRFSDMKLKQNIICSSLFFHSIMLGNRIIAVMFVPLLSIKLFASYITKLKCAYLIAKESGMGGESSL
jgi:hypothetical protein